MDPCTMNSHQAMMKCPWQWRQPFLDEKLESRKRKVGDGYFYDPVDPSFVDHLYPGHAKKFCMDVLGADEKEKIEQEIQRLMTKKHDEVEVLSIESTMIAIESELYGGNQCSNSSTQCVSSVTLTDSVNVRLENEALVESIVLLSKSVAEASTSSLLLASPESAPSSSSDEEEDVESSDEQVIISSETTSLELISDNVQANFFADEDNELLNFSAPPSPSHDRSQ